jgi:DNA-binding XRE family transcriptional regulator
MDPKRTRTYSKHASVSLQLIGRLIHQHRLERKFTATELAERAGISRGTVHRIEKGDPKCEAGLVFELACLVGIPLFQSDTPTLTARTHHVEEKLALLPKRIRHKSAAVNDDF